MNELSTSPLPLAAPDPDARIVGWIVPLAVICCLFLAAAAIVLYTSYDPLPERIPTHYGIDGKADAYRAKSAAIVALPLVMGALVSALMLALLYGIACGTRCVGEGEEEELARQWGQRRMVAGTMAALTLVLNLLFCYVALSPVVSPNGMLGGPGVLLGVVLAVVALAIWMAIKMSGAGEETPDERWTLGLFYYNPQDRAMLVARRVGFGYTPNFARPLGWVIILLALALAAVPFVMPRLG